MNRDSKQYIIHKLTDGTYSNTFNGGELINNVNITSSSETALEVGSVFKVDTINNKVCITDGTEGVGKVLESDANGCATWVTPTGGGETNTASNQGVGAGVFKQKTGVDLELRSVVGGTGLTQTQNVDDITLDLDNTTVTPGTYGTSNDVSTITIDQQGRITSASDTAIDHDSLLNFVSNEHIDHSTVSINNGTGISATGLGDLTASRTINLADTTVTPATYGDSNSVGQFTVNQQGQLTSASNVDIDHNSLLNFVANEHIDWTSATSAFTTNIADPNALDIQNGSGVDVFNVNTTATPPVVKVDGKLTIEEDAGEAFLVRKDNDAGDVFKISTSGDLITSLVKVFITHDSGNALRVRDSLLNDVFVVNTTAPRVDISAPMRYIGTTPTVDYVLKTNASGDATWSAPNVVTTTQTLVTTFSSTSLASPQAATIKCSKFNDTIIINYTQLFWAGSGTAGVVVSDTAIDAAFRPTGNDFFGVMRSRSNGTRALGIVRVGTNGILTFWSTATLGTFANTGSNEIYRCSISYIN